MPSSRPPPGRIASLLPSATEIICALGLGDRLVLRSHECDHPARVTELPFATSPKIVADGTSYGIDERIRGLVQEGLSVYRVDAEVLREAAPEVIVTQDHCEVCAVPADEIRTAARTLLDPPPEIVSLRPSTLADIFSDIARVGAALGVPARGERLATELRRRMERIAEQARRTVRGSPPRVLTIEWLDPLMVAGNWMPELVAMAGGESVAGTPGEHSPFADWNELRGLDPDVIVVLPCGFSIERTVSEMEALTSREGWEELRAVRDGRVAVADGHHFFNRPGPRIAESLEILVEILHPDGPDHGHRGSGWMPWSGVEPAEAGAQ